MTYFDGLTEHITRRGKDGRVYYAPIGRFGPLYLVPDDASHASLKRDWRRLFIGVIVALGLLPLVLGPAWFLAPSWRMLPPALVAGALAVAYGFWLARRLPRATISHQELVRMSYSDAQQRTRAAMGPKAWGFVLGSSIVMSVVALIMAVVTPSLTAWLSAAFIAICAALLLRTHLQGR